MAIAGSRLARARCRIQPVPNAIPTAAELRVAASGIARYVGMRFTLSARQLVADCEHAGPGGDRADQRDRRLGISTSAASVGPGSTENWGLHRLPLEREREALGVARLFPG